MPTSSKNYTDAFIAYQKGGGWILRAGNAYSVFQYDETTEDKGFAALALIISKNAGKTKADEKLAFHREDMCDWRDTPHGAMTDNELIAIYDHIIDEMDQSPRIKTRVVSYGGLDQIAQDLISDARYVQATLRERQINSEDDAIENMIAEFIARLGYDPSASVAVKYA